MNMGKNNNSNNQKRQKSHANIRWMLLAVDSVFYLFTAVFFLLIYPSYIDKLTTFNVLLATFTSYICIFGARFLFNIYRQIWRYGSTQAYLRLILADFLSGLVLCLLRSTPAMPIMTFPRLAALCAVNLLFAISARILYQFAHQTSIRIWPVRVLIWILNKFYGAEIKEDARNALPNRVRVAIVGAGAVGVSLCEELFHNNAATDVPVCFVDTKHNKVGRQIYGLPVIDERIPNLKNELMQYDVQEVVIAIPNMNPAQKKRLYEKYKSFGFKVMTYDYPSMLEAGRRQLREYDIEELLFRTPKDFLTDKTKAYYKGKKILITGGGGSIGSEMCRQIARMQPAQLIILDVYENGAYDVQQELRRKYKDAFDLQLEITTICDTEQLDQIFDYYKPDIVIHAAAHKHVPILQHNSIEGVKNNIFGTEGLLKICEKYNVSRFMMVSTDKAVNPTNVMGATKRFCEMMVLNHQGNMKVSATRFGNVLGSAGSVIPLFRSQIKAGGPITLTDKRIVRYFMTIPEASQLVLTSGAMAENRDLFVLDMGKPVRILDLAENMIRLSGFEPYKDIDIVETGLRPGEKLYEELLIKGETLTKTDNEMIYIEREEQIDHMVLQERLDMLHAAVETMNSKTVRETLYKAVPTYRDAAEVNAKAEEAEEMKAGNRNV